MVEHKDEKMYVPTLIFGHLLTSSNYNDEEEKVTGWSCLCLVLSWMNRVFHLVSSCTFLFPYQNKLLA